MVRTLIHLCVNYIVSLNHQKIGEGEGLTLIVVLILIFWLFQTHLLDSTVSVSVCVCVCVSDSLQPHGLEPARLLCPWDSPGKNTVGCHFFLQRIFPTQGSNSHLLHLLHCRQIVNHCATCGTSDSIPHNNKS